MAVVGSERQRNSAAFCLLTKHFLADYLIVPRLSDPSNQHVNTEIGKMAIKYFAPQTGTMCKMYKIKMVVPFCAIYHPFKWLEAAQTSVFFVCYVICFVA